jgi:hypothetical protein
VVLLVLAALPALGACAQTVTYHGAQSRELNGKPLLLLRPTLLPPTSPELHERVVRRIEAAMAQLEGVGKVLDAGAVEAGGMTLAAQNAYIQFSNTLSLTGVSDPELSRRLFDALNVELLTVALPAYLPCPACEAGDELWLVGYVVQARTGRLVLRTHLRLQGVSSEPAALAALADDLATRYLTILTDAFALRPHLQRFEHLRPG